MCYCVIVDNFLIISIIHVLKLLNDDDGNDKYEERDEQK